MTRRPAPVLLSTALALLAACGHPPAAAAPRTFVHEAYVWQRAWTGDVSEAVASAPAELGALRVLVREWSGVARARVDVAVDALALARSRRPAVLVMRVDGTLPLDGLDLASLVPTARAWQAAGVAVRGLEVDYDCPTSRLAAYADWLARMRPAIAPLRLSITALPSWSASKELRRLGSVVDDVSLQVHTVREPRLFDPTEAAAFVASVATALDRPFFVALPTYRARLRDGTPLDADPAQIQAFLATLARSGPALVAGIAWFRLGRPADRDAWSEATWSAVVHGRPLLRKVEVRVVPATDGSGAFDLVATNLGNVDADAPGRLSLAGSIELVDGLRGYFVESGLPTLLSSNPPRLRPGETVPVGLARGSELSLVLP